jgi:hypothetical protein
MNTRMLCPRLLLSLAAVGISLVFTATAAAEDAGPRALSWWVEGRPWTCSDPVGAVARHVSLACDASGGRCRIAARRDEADRIASIACGTGNGPWRLIAEDRTGEPLWSVVLAGDEDARVRKAALWIARAESADAVADPAVDAPPAPQAKPAEPTLSAPPSDPPAPPEPPTVAASPAAPPAAEAPAAAHVSGDGGRIAMTASLMTAASAPPGQPGPPVPMAGARFAAALGLATDVYAGAAIDAVTTLSNGDSTTYSHLGGLVAVGAPYAHDWLGASLEGGLALNSTSAAAPGNIAKSPYGKGTLVVQWPRENGVRPYLSASYLASRDDMNRSLVLDLGLAW